MVCNLHPNRQASSTCEICGQPFCEECLVEVDGKFYCKEHVAQLVSAPTPRPPHDQPYGSYHYPNHGYDSSGAPNINIYNTPHAPFDPYYGYYPYKNKVVALLLCIFLGVAGFHRFYVGKIGSGILYLFTGGLFGIGWIVDIVTIITGSFRDTHGYPLI